MIQGKEEDLNLFKYEFEQANGRFLKFKKLAKERPEVYGTVMSKEELLNAKKNKISKEISEEVRKVEEKWKKKYQELEFKYQEEIENRMFMEQRIYELQNEISNLKDNKMMSITQEFDSDSDDSVDFMLN